MRGAAVARPTARTLGKNAPDGRGRERLPFQYKPLKELRENTYNANAQTPEQFELLCKSIETAGFTQPIVITPDSEIVDGAHRARAARVLGIEHVPVVVVKDLTDYQRRVSTLLHNRARGEEDAAALDELYRELAELGGTAALQSDLRLAEEEMERVIDMIDIKRVDAPTYMQDQLPSRRPRMRTLVGWYGGKQKMAKTIAALIPPHTTYIEPYAGSAAVLFSKEPSKHEVISDLKKSLVAFYTTYKTNYNALLKRVEALPTARSCFEDCQAVLRTATDKTPRLELAVAVFYLRIHAHLYSVEENGKATFGIVQTPTSSYNRCHTRKAYIERLKAAHGRLDNCVIENRSALRVIDTYDRPAIEGDPGSFFYLDPPYINSADKNTIHQGDYSGFTEDDYSELLDALTELQGRFILSSYDNPLLADAIQENNWRAIGVYMDKSSSSRDAGRGNVGSIELIVANYPLEIEP